MAALISSFKNVTVSEKTIVFGEVGLTGEVRAVSMVQQRINEAAKLGYSMCVIPKVNMRGLEVGSNIEVVGISSVKDIMKMFG